ncbi:D-alanyl-D-alanine carboxypeptidase [Pleomorphomonas sp. T1.2MG-36]|nr:D-alanyl-D-alanine carboxypeptidase [Pleomorphomonas sp. T1.2MG-36]
MSGADGFGLRADMAAFETRLQDLMTRARVPGLSLFAIRNGTRDMLSLGVRSTQTREPVDGETVFEAASLSKPLVACAALRLVDAGTLDLDEPLSRFAGPIVADDPASARITARHVLSHTTGLPNWRRDDLPLRTHFPPGSRFSYSGEGFVYLQSALERLTGEPLELLVRRLVLDPLGMERSSFVWLDVFSEAAACGHDGEGKVLSKFKPSRANAAFSLHTTASDYGNFVVAAMEGRLLSASTAGLWLEPQVPTPRGRFEALGPGPIETEPGVSWGLGWGLEPEDGAFFHWGSNPGMTAFVLAEPETRTAFVAFMNGDAGLDIVPDIAGHLFQGRHPALTWLELPQAS